MRMLIFVKMKVSGEWRAIRCLLDSGAEENFVSRTFCKQYDLKLLRGKDDPSTMKTLSDGKEIIYGHTEVQSCFTDAMGTERRANLKLFAVDMTDYEVVIGYPWLFEANPIIDWRKKEWRFKYDMKTLHLDPPKKFIKHMRLAIAYALLPRFCKASLSESEEIPEEYQDFADVFSEKDAAELPPIEGRQHPIELKEGEEPPYGPIYALSETELGILREYLDINLGRGWITRSKSPAGAPILFVPKKDGGLRLCVDYRGLNSITVKNRYPLPLIGETLDRLSGAEIFTKLDLRDAYHRVRIKPGDEWKTAFRTRYGHYEYQVMPFGLANAPATFQAYINDALRDLIDITCVVYLDDILVFSSDPAKHKQDVREVLTRLREYRLYAKLSKCEFSTTQVEFLGYVVSREGIAIEKSRVQSIREWPEPRTFREVQVFLGFANFYRRFIRAYSAIARPLTSMMKGAVKGKKTGPFEWGYMEQEAFERLKDAFISAPVLIHFDPAKPIRLETDASGKAIAGILSQPSEWPLPKRQKPEYHPVAFYSEKMDTTEENYGTPDQELMAIVKSFAHWRHYLEGARYPIEVLTDHNNLKYFMKTTALSRRQARYAQVLAAFDFEITHRPGKSNPADAPSRRPDYMFGRDDENVMLPTLRNKLRVAREKGLIREMGLAQSLTDRATRPTMASILAAHLHRSGTPGPESLRAYDLPGQFTASLNVIGLDHPDTETELLEEAVDPPPYPVELQGNGKHSHEYALPRFVVAAAMQTETAYDYPSNNLLSLMSELQKRDAVAAERRKRLAEDPAGDANWTIQEDGLLLFQGKAYVPREEALKAEIMKICHDDPLAGHFGQEKTLELVARKYYWPSMRLDVREYVKTCDVCQRTKAKRQRQAGKMQAPDMPSKPFESISMDFITDLSPSKDPVTNVVYDSVFVIVDRYTKFARYIPTLKTATAEDVAWMFQEYWFRDCGLPANIISDRDTKFTGKFWSKLCYNLRITRALSTAFHPQTDGQTERQNQNLEGWLRNYVCPNQDDWVELLPIAEFAYNNSIHSSIGMSPNQARYGINLETRQGVEVDTTRGEIPTATEHAERMTKLRERLENSWAESKKQQAKYFNQKHKPTQFNAGQRVLLSAQNIRTVRTSKKLNQRFLGPFEILKKIGSQAYRLKLPYKYKRLHDVFHVSLLAEYYPRPGETQDIVQPDLIDGVEEWEVESILNKRIQRNRVQYLVHWKGFPVSDDEWCGANQLQNAQELVREFEDRLQAVESQETHQSRSRKKRKRD